MMRHVSLWSVLAFAFVLVLPVQAQEENTSAVLASVSVENIKTHQNFDDITVSFDIINNGDSVETDLHYVIDLHNTGENKEDQNDDYLAYHKSFDDVLSLSPGQKIHKEVLFSAPHYLNGEHETWVRVVNSSSLSLSQMVKRGPLRFAKKAQAMNIDENSCYVYVEGADQDYGLKDGVDLAAEEGLRVKCNVDSTYVVPQVFMPHFTTYYRSLNGNIIEEKNGENITIEPGGKEIVFEIPLVADPQAYDVGIDLRDANGKQISNAVYAHYVLQGKSATIQNVKFDKESYDSGDEATIDLFWTSSADQFVSDVRRGDGSALSDETKALLILTSDGKECAAKTEESLMSGDGTFVINIAADCPHPSLALEIIDGDQKLATGIFEVGGEDSEEIMLVGEGEERKSMGMIFLWFLGITIVVIVIIIVVRSIGSPKNGVKVLAFLTIAGGMLFGGGAEAAFEPVCVGGVNTASGINSLMGVKTIGSRTNMSYVTCDSVALTNGNTILVGGTGWGGDAPAAFTTSFSSDSICAGGTVRMTYDAKDSYCTNGSGYTLGGLYVDAPSGQTDEWLMDFDSFYVGDVANTRTSSGYRDYQFMTAGTYVFTLKGYGGDRDRGYRLDPRDDYAVPGHQDEQPMTKTVTVHDCAPAACGTANSTTRDTVPSTNAELCGTGSLDGSISVDENGWTWDCTHTDTSGNTSTTSPSCTADRANVDPACTLYTDTLDTGENLNPEVNDIFVGPLSWQSGSFDIAAPIGRYRVYLEALDSWTDRGTSGQTQSHERYYVALKDASGNVIVNTGETEELPNDVDHAQWGGRVNKVNHSDYGDNNFVVLDRPSVTGQRIFPAGNSHAGPCMVMRPIPEPSICGADAGKNFLASSPAPTALCPADHVLSTALAVTAPQSSLSPNWTWGCTHEYYGSVETSCVAHIEPEVDSSIIGLNDPEAYNDAYKNSPPAILCTSGIMKNLNDSGSRWSWECWGMKHDATTNPYKEGFVQYACATTELECDLGNKCLDIDAVNGIAILTKEGVSGDKTMSVNIINDTNDPTACSSGDIQCTFDLSDPTFTDGMFTILKNQSNGTYVIDGDELGTYIKDTSVTSLTIDTVECTITKSGTTWASDDDAKIDFKCQKAQCDGPQCKKGLQPASSYDECTSACSTNAECTDSTGTIKEVQP